LTRRLDDAILRDMKKIFRHPATTRVLAALISAYMYVVFATSRVHVLTPLPTALLVGPVILASWHQQIPMVPVMHRPNLSKLLALVSGRYAGSVIQAVAKWYGVGVVEGSNRRGGTAGARRLVKAARENHSIYITPDGSSGPACIAKAGATEIARLTHLPLVPCAAWPTRGKTFDTWDRFRLPYPFTTFRVAYGEPLEILTPQGLGDALNRLTANVQGLCEPPRPKSLERSL
jgi:lysophospholipid acyltransferase (LPLAT)-like uncharacterized protein